MVYFYVFFFFVFGCGIKNELDYYGGFTYRFYFSIENFNDSDYISDSFFDSVCNLFVIILVKESWREKILWDIIV